MPAPTELPTEPIRRRTKAEILDYLINKYAELEVRVSQLESADDWDTPLDEHPDAAQLAAQHFGETPQRGVEFPPEWPRMNEEQRGAWLREVADTGQPGHVPPLPETVVVPIAGGIEATFPAPPDEVRQLWRQTAPAIFEGLPADYALSPEKAAEAYNEGGPLWLAAYDHDYLMGLPVGYRQQMVEQVSRYAPVAAMELGRDVLRHGTESANAYALAQAHDDAEKRLAQP